MRAPPLVVGEVWVVLLCYNEIIPVKARGSLQQLLKKLSSPVERCPRGALNPLSVKILSAVTRSSGQSTEYLIGPLH